MQELQALELIGAESKSQTLPDADMTTKKGKKTKKSKKVADVKISLDMYDNFKKQLKEIVLKHTNDPSLVRGWDGEEVPEDNNDPAISDKPEGEDDPSPDVQNDDPAQAVLETEQDSLLDQTPIQILEDKVRSKQEKIDSAKLQIASLNSIIEGDASKEAMLESLASKYDPAISELFDKNIVGCTKIQTLYSKVKKSREKIDQVLQDTRQFQKEFETIQVNNKCRPLKLKISRKVLESRLDSYKSYLVHLQTVIEGLERQIREFKRKEKEYNKLAKIQGVGVAQKHNTQADILKKKIEVLESQIQKKLKQGDKQASPPKKPKKKSLKSNTFGAKRASLGRSKGPTNLANELKTARNDNRDRDDQIKLLQDMLNSSAHQSKMKGTPPLFLTNFV